MIFSGPIVGYSTDFIVLIGPASDKVYYVNYYGLPNDIRDLSPENAKQGVWVMPLPGGVVCALINWSPTQPRIGCHFSTRAIISNGPTITYSGAVLKNTGI